VLCGASAAPAVPDPAPAVRRLTTPTPTPTPATISAAAAAARPPRRRCPFSLPFAAVRDASCRHRDYAQRLARAPSGLRIRLAPSARPQAPPAPLPLSPSSRDAVRRYPHHGAAGSHAYAAAMQSLVTPFGAFCSNHLARLARVPVWLDQE
jgi:hypothetical protein